MIKVLPEAEAAPSEGQGVVTGRLASLVIRLVTSELVAGLTVTQVVLCVLVEVAIFSRTVVEESGVS